MKKLLIIVLLAILPITLKAQHPSVDPNWDIEFIDHCNILNTSRWYVETGVRQAGMPNEDVTYRRAENVTTCDGELHLHVKRDTLTHSPCYHAHMGVGTHYFSSASLMSHATYSYGYFEIHAKLPAHHGYWPAFWLWNSDASQQWENEIDIFEALGYEPDSVIGNLHWLYQQSTDTAWSFYCGSIADYHWYGVEWDGDRINWYVDRQLVRSLHNRLQGTCINHPLHIILSVGLDNANPDNLLNEALFVPDSMQIDEINVYKLKCHGNISVVEIPNFSTYTYGVKKKITLSGATTLPAGSNISLRAANYIELTNGFEVPLGTEFFADVNPCP